MTVNDYFLGAEMSALSCDKFAIEKIEDEVLKEDLVLMDHKWWDYRAMHPTKATMYFYHLYNQIVSGFISRNISTAEGLKFSRAAGKMNLRYHPLATIRGFWKARMAADAIGVPYEIYIRGMLEDFYGAYRKFASTAKKKQIQPYAAQMASHITIGKIVKEWEEARAAKLYLPESELILNQQVWFRDDMEASIKENAKLTDHPDFFLAKAARVGAILGPA